MVDIAYITHKSMPSYPGCTSNWWQPNRRLQGRNSQWPKTAIKCPLIFEGPSFEVLNSWSKIGVKYYHNHSANQRANQPVSRSSKSVCFVVFLFGVSVDNAEYVSLIHAQNIAHVNDHLYHPIDGPQLPTTTHQLGHLSNWWKAIQYIQPV